MHGECNVLENNCSTVCGEHVGAMLEFISNSNDIELCSFRFIDDIYGCYIGANFHLLLVRKRSQDKSI